MRPCELSGMVPLAQEDFMVDAPKFSLPRFKGLLRAEQTEEAVAWVQNCLAAGEPPDRVRRLRKTVETATGHPVAEKVNWAQRLEEGHRLVTLRKVLRSDPNRASPAMAPRRRGLARPGDMTP